MLILYTNSYLCLVAAAIVKEYEDSEIGEAEIPVSMSSSSGENKLCQGTGKLLYILVVHVVQ